MNKFFAKGFVIILGFMLFFTLISRAADSFLVAQVRMEKPSGKRIEHIVNVQGNVQKNLEIPIMTEPGLLIKTVYVQEGSYVKEGDLLAELELQQLEEQMSLIRDEIKTLQLQNQALLENRAKTMQEEEKQRQRADEDYERILQKSEEMLRRTEEEMQQAETAIDSFCSLEKSMEQEQIESRKAELWQAYFAKKQAHEDAKMSYEEAVEAAKRATQDAETAGTSDYSKEINDITISQREKTLKSYEQIAKRGGKIKAEEAGYVTGVSVQTGQKTTDAAAFTLAVTERGVRLLAEITKEDAPYVEMGDTVTVEKSGKKYEGFSVTGIKQTDDGGVELSVGSEEYGDIFQIGDSAKLSIVKQSEVYSTAVPLSAIHTEQKKNYVYVTEQQDTVLGMRLFVRKAEVRIIEKNSSYAALEEGVLSGDNLVVIDSDRYIQAGDRVRLQEP